MGAAWEGALPHLVEYVTEVKYDQSMLDHFQGSHARARDWVTRVLALAQPKLQAPTLVIKVKLKWDGEGEDWEGIGYLDERIGGAGLAGAKKILSKKVEHAVQYFAADLGGGTHGIAPVSGACRTNGAAMSITELYRRRNAEIQSSITFAHEVGHT